MHPIGLKEGVEGTSMEDLLETWFRSRVPADKLSRCFIVERALRALVKKPPQGAPLHPVVAHILNHCDRDTILREA
ncbi:hypothetical protein NDU88_003609 [Pleurodeles waltl]|uniref:Uncharacterized protein n=1 Tax=Pleurodeles waltl TaxID=8319 RepID=A0AAV7WPK2_PLEWA|nr:hypothetical protein NDU88_003609 [Pleurodeles waltl]